MAYYNDGKTFRNLPEQVDKNKTDIEEMQSTVEADEKNINDNINKILAHDTRINALETTKLSAVDDSIKLTRSNAEMGSVSIAKVGGNTLVNGNDIPLATINGESIMQDKDFTIDSNLSSLLWANLGIGRWANHSFYAFYWDTNITIYDTLAPYYVNCNRYMSNIKCIGRDNNNLMPNCTITLEYNFGKTTGDYMFYGMVNPISLVLPSIVFSGNVMWFTFSNCPNLKSILVKDGCKVYCSPAIYYIFKNCPNLTTIGTLDMSKVNTMIDVFAECSSLKTIKWTNVHCSFNISSSTAFETEDLVEIISNLDPVSTTQTLTMGATNLAKLSNDDILIATGKGWQLA